MFFGVLKLYTSLPKQYVNFISISIFMLVTAISIYFPIKPSIEKRKIGKVSMYKETAENLYEHVKKVKESIEDICLGYEYCGKCQGSDCIIGYTKIIINDLEKGNEYKIEEDYEKFTKSLMKEFNKEKVLNTLIMVVEYISIHTDDTDQKFMLHQVRQNLEKILFKEELTYNGNVKEYLALLKEKEMKI